ncbi:MAG: patatin-like phospholipase family protein [Myxococcales bacterium]|nr:patatin-like phospholipase family protein [Myxococcales bacterium]
MPATAPDEGAPRPGAERSARPRVGLVLAGGAARGAYEVGVLEHIVEEVSRDLGYDVPLDVLCGTSVGAVNVATLAAFADEPRSRVARLSGVWKNLRIDEMLRPRHRGVYAVGRALFGRTPLGMAGALFESGPLAELLERNVPFARIDEHLRAGRVQAVALSATQIATGRTVVFVQRRHASPEPWEPTSAVVPQVVRLRPVHALASAALPMLFPAVAIDGHYYCDGGLRQNIPLSPARRLGAAGVIVVNPRYRPARGGAARGAAELVEQAPSALFMFGKALNALLLDRIDNDLDRLEKINDILEAGTRRYGPDFTRELNVALGRPPEDGLRQLHTVHIRCSANVGELGADHVRAPGFHVGGVLGRIMRQLAEAEATREADLLSYLLFDGEFAKKLIELGRSDARSHHDELCALFERLRTDRPG